MKLSEFKKKIIKLKGKKTGNILKRQMDIKCIWLIRKNKKDY